VSNQSTKGVTNQQRQQRRARRRGVKGRALLLYRLAARDLRHHVAQAVLLLVAIAAATTVLTLAFALNGVTSHPYQETRAATKGPDVVAYIASPSQAKALLQAKGVAVSSGPYPMASALLHFDGRTAGALVEGRSEAAALVDQPVVLSGSWVRPGGVVLERTFAEALGVRVGGHMTLNGHSFDVAGIAVTAAQPPYPNLCYTTVNVQRGSIHSGAGAFTVLSSACGNLTFFGEGPNNIGLVWMTQPDAVRLASKASRAQQYALNLKLDDPAAAQAFADAHTSAGNSGPTISTWERVATADALLVSDAQSVLKPGALLLGLLALASVAVLVGSRLAEHTRRVGLLKAVGGTPGLVAAAFLAENLLLALVAAFVGLLAGWLAPPLLTSPGAGLVGAPGAPSLTFATVLVVFAVALVVALAATFVPATRAARTSTVSALADAPRQPKRRDLLIRVSRRLPVPALFGLRLVARRPRRSLLSAASIAVTVMGLVAVLAFHADVDKKLSGFSSSGELGNPVFNRDEQMLTVITILLITLAVLTVIFTAWATVLDARRSSAVALALGATPQQVGAGLAMAQVMSALPGAFLGIPLGIGLFKLAAKGLGGLPPAIWLVVAVLGTLFVVAALTSIPARIGTRRPVAEILQAEAA
jgi:ABC-type antimicrobial peptide transport system permease subunit